MSQKKKLNLFYNKQALSLALRPKSFEKMYGQDDIIKSIRSLYKKHKCWMFTGHPGVGKTSFARIMSLAFNCTHHKKFGAYCSKCQDNKSELDIAEVDGAKLNTVEHISKLIDLASYEPTSPSKVRVIILDEAQRLSKESQTLLLKPLEPKNINVGKTIWIFCTTMPWKIDAAIRSRCMMYNVPNLNHKTTDAFVKWAAKKAEVSRPLSDFLDYLHKHEISAPRNILMMLEKYASGLDPDKAAGVAELSVNTMRICKGIAAGEWSHIRAELARATPDDVRLVRGALLGFFRQQLMERTPTMSRKLIVATIEGLSDIPYSLDEVSQLALLSARVYSLTEKFSKA